MSDAEQSRIAEECQEQVEDLKTSRLVSRVDILRENLRFLLASSEHGAQKEVARQIGVSETTISRWRNERKPHPENLITFQRVLGISTDVDLQRDPAFLSMNPVGARDRRDWLHRRVDALPDEDLHKFFPALERLLRDK